MASGVATIYSLPSEVLAKILASGLSVKDVGSLADADVSLVAPLASVAVRSKIWQQTYEIPARITGADEICQWSATIYSVIGDLNLSNTSVTSSIRQSRARFKKALSELVEGAKTLPAADSENLRIIHRCLVKPVNTYFLAQAPNAHMPRLLATCLHMLFDTQLRPHHGWSHLPNLRYHAYTSDIEMFSLRNLDNGSDSDGVALLVVQTPGINQFLSIAQLFRFHFIYAMHEGISFTRYRCLPLSQRPKGWTGPISQNDGANVKNLPAFWKGASSSMGASDVQHLHRMYDRDGPSFQVEVWHDWFDYLDDDEAPDGFENLWLQFPDQAIQWFPRFNEYFAVQPGKNVRSLYGLLRAQGIVYALSGGLEPVHDVSLGPTVVSAAGFQRLFFIAIPYDTERQQVYADIDVEEVVNDSEWADSLNVSCFAFEGLVVPGGQMVAGQWKATVAGWRDFDRWDRIDFIGLGPFIFWSVDYDDGQEEDRALDRLREF